MSGIVKTRSPLSEGFANRGFARPSQWPREHRTAWVVPIILLVTMAPSICVAAINIEFRPMQKIARPGDMVDAGLYAVSDNASNQPISAMDVLLQWNPATLQLIAAVNNGPYNWFDSGFLPDTGLDGLNNTFDDGDAKYTALAQFGNPAMATPAGLLVTTIRFQAIAETPLNTVTIPLMLGSSSKTAVYGTAFPGQDVTGTLGQANVLICTGAADGDINLDGNTDGLDIQTFTQAAMMESTTFSDVCRADFSGDSKVSVNDIAGMVQALLGG